MTENKFFIHAIPSLHTTPDQLLSTLYDLPIKKESIKINEHQEILIEIPDNRKDGLTTTDHDFGLKHIREALAPSSARMFIQTIEPDEVDDTRMIEHREYIPIEKENLK